MSITKLLHTSYGKEDPYNALSIPVYNSAAFEFSSAEEMEAAFCGIKKMHTYSRVSNPTVEYFEERIKVLSEAKYVTALSSGMAAISNVFATIAYSGANIISSPSLFGNTFSFFSSTLKAFGVEIRFCNLQNPDEVEKQIDQNTCAIFFEILTNPNMEVEDIKSLSVVALRNNLPLIADTTLIPWCSFKAKNFGVNIEVVSSTKYISGGGTSVGGLIIDHANFNWEQSYRLKNINFCSEDRFNFKLRNEITRNFGAIMAPQTAYIQNIGLETMELRYKKATENCNSLASYLESMPEVKKVNYPGLLSNPFHSIAKKQFEDNGALLSFELKDKQTCFRFLNNLKVIKRATNLFENKSLIIHPLSTIYGTLSEENKKKVNISEGLLRLSVGLERVEDIKKDIQEALILTK